MCLIAFAWRARSRWPLVLIANRDEFHARPATAAEAQADAPQVHGGRDLEKQGSWLQLSTQRRLAAVTNVRAGPLPPAAPRSRGQLVTEFVRSRQPAGEWLQQLAPHAAQYGGFNLLLWDGTSLMLAGNQAGAAPRYIEPGVHGISNGPFDAPWPKVRRARAALSHWIADDPPQGEPDLQRLFDVLADEHVAPDEQLPDTGVGLALERALSPVFLRGERYGTRASSIVLVGREVAWFAERRFGPMGAVSGMQVQRLTLEPAPPQ
jgi:uncharacterized protein with NRDE domain